MLWTDVWIGNAKLERRFWVVNYEEQNLWSGEEGRVGTAGLFVVVLGVWVLKFGRRE